jgi:glycosyltransferase involved in cell wall biosynthesis
VLQLVDTLSAGGAERLLVTIARLGPQADLDIDVAVLRADGPRGAMAPLLRSEGVTPAVLGFRRLADPGALRRLTRHVRAGRYDLVHAHLEYSAIAGAAAATLCRRPLVVTLHHVSAPAGRKAATLERVAVEGAGRRAARLIFVSNASRASFAARYRARPNWTVLPNGVELPDPARTNGHAVARDRRPRAVLVGTMRPGKGHAEAVDAWVRVADRIPDAELVFVGTGELERELRHRAAARGIADRVVFAGFTHDVHTEIAEADVVLLPTRQEALPTVLMEAAALAKPVVATAVPGVTEVVQDGITGVLVAERNPAAFADAVTALLGDEERRRSLGAAAQRRAETAFDARAWVARLAGIYTRATR